MSMTGDITIRAIRPDDEPILRRIYAGTRQEELAIVPWNDSQKEAFLRMQFDAQHRYYQDQFPHACFDLILRECQPVGRLYVDRREDEVRIIDIALLPESRGDGIGGRLLKELIAEAGSSHKPLRIHVERFNRAISLYRRLGFTPIGEGEVYYEMEWNPDAHRV
jgi:ribosomal protein S18 acetylase RimI-like enzyme